jgi:hypothetical protein
LGEENQGVRPGLSRKTLSQKIYLDAAGEGEPLAPFPGAVLHGQKGVTKAKGGLRKNFSDVNKQPIGMVKLQGARLTAWPARFL